LQGQHYFSIALGAILAAGGAAMLMHGPRAAAGRDTPTTQRPDAPAKADLPVAPSSPQR
jgi:hypothetical protein